MPLPILAMMLCTFSIGTAESVIAGILPRIADDLGVSLSAAGLLVSVYAAVVVVVGPLMTLATGRLARKPLLLGMLALFTLGNVIAALAAPAGSYALLVTGRLVSAFAHSTVFAICLTSAGELAPPGQRASAGARITLGFGLAMVLGVPLGTFVGQHYGWSATFWTITAMSLACLALLARCFPSGPQRPTAGGGGSTLAELRVLARPRVLRAIAITVFCSAGVFTAFTYAVPLLTDVSGFGEQAVTALLLLYGAGGVAGNALGGKAADRSLVPSLAVILAAVTGALLLLAAVASLPWLTAGALLLLGLAYFGTVPGLNTIIVTSAEVGSPTLALSVNSSAFNIGIAAGGLLGGAAVQSGAGLRAAPVVGAAVVALGLALCAYELKARRPARVLAASPSGKD
ncbi:MFS transporter [Streptomyces hiroshimensis]|uniref:MFS transporter n=1 Tax=Streptomyces hiroshimensis TaxID=66424 RepID=A0ABQ2YV49_9ACTN|nr:MFS transporter [Streptomyces hiroshimensis]GGX93242.1 MFS transporter [Streptomyces hiroshimensis]